MTDSPVSLRSDPLRYFVARPAELVELLLALVQMAMAAWVILAWIFGRPPISQTFSPSFDRAMTMIVLLVGIPAIRVCLDIFKENRRARPTFWLVASFVSFCLALDGVLHEKFQYWLAVYLLLVTTWLYFGIKVLFAREMLLRVEELRKYQP